MRISRGRVAAIVAAAVVVVVAIVVLVDRGDSDDPLPVEVAAYGDYPGRGPKIGDQKLLDAAAQAWRDDTDADERPGDDVEALYAGGMSDLQLRPGFGGYDNVRDVVVLASRTSIATATHQADGSWGIDAVTRTLSSLETDPVIDLGNGAYLVADRFDSNSEAIELPQVRLDGAESPQTPSSEPDGPRRFAAELGRVLWSPQQRGSGSFVVRLPGTKQGTFAGQAWLLADANDQDRPAFTTAAGKAGSDDELWAQLLSPRDSANTVIAVGTGLEEIHLNQATRNDIYGPALPIRPLGSAMLRDTPDGDRRISAIALGRPGGWGGVVAVGLTGADAKGDARTLGAVLGEAPRTAKNGEPIAAKWFRSEVGGLPYLVYAANPDLDRLELRVGAREIDIRDSIGFYAPPVKTVPLAALLGYDRHGIAYPSFPIEGQ